MNANSETLTPRINEQDMRDLGFGSVVSHEEKLRLLNRDGTFNVERTGLSAWQSQSSYQWLLTMPWWQFFTVVVSGYVVINVLFAWAYVACGPETLQGSPEIPYFLRAFFFSVETFATIGYGNIVPVGVPANVVVTLESLFGLLGLALVTGLLFSRFSRPNTKIIYSRSAVIAPYREITAFEFRITNARSNQLIEVAAKIVLSRFEGAGAGRQRKYYQLNLERPQVAFFPLSWTIVHPIDESSPLFDWSPERLHSSNAEFLILLTAIDETFSQTVHSRSSYRADEIIWNAKFANLFVPMSKSGDLAIDLTRFHELERQ